MRPGVEELNAPTWSSIGECPHCAGLITPEQIEFGPWRYSTARPRCYYQRTITLRCQFCGRVSERKQKLYTEEF